MSDCKFEYGCFDYEESDIVWDLINEKPIIELDEALSGGFYKDFNEYRAKTKHLEYMKEQDGYVTYRYDETEDVVIREKEEEVL